MFGYAEGLPNKLHVAEFAERGKKEGKGGRERGQPPTLFHVAQFLFGVTVLRYLSVSLSLSP